MLIIIRGRKQAAFLQATAAESFYVLCQAIRQAVQLFMILGTKHKAAAGIIEQYKNYSSIRKKTLGGQTHGLACIPPPIPFPFSARVLLATICVSVMIKYNMSD